MSAFKDEFDAVCEQVATLTTQRDELLAALRELAIARKLHA